MTRLCALPAIALALIVPALASGAPPPSFAASLEAEMAKAKITGVSIAVINDYRIEYRGQKTRRRGGVVRNASAAICATIALESTMKGSATLTECAERALQIWAVAGVVVHAALSVWTTPGSMRPLTLENASEILNNL